MMAVWRGVVKEEELPIITIISLEFRPWSLLPLKKNPTTVPPHALKLFSF